MVQATQRSGRRTLTSRPAAAAWTPLSLSSKLLWLDGTTLPGDGSAVAAWNCSFGTGRSAAQSNPTFRPTAAVGGGASFNAAHRLIVAHESALNPAALNIAIVLTSNAEASFAQPFSKTNDVTWTTGWAASWMLAVPPKLRFFLDGWSTTFVEANFNATEGPNVFLMTFAAPTMAIQKDAGSQVTGSHVGAYTANTANLTIGSANDGSGAGTYPYKGIIREFILCGGTTAWDSTTRSQVQTYLKAKHGTP